MCLERPAQATPRQPITRAFVEVLEALLWGFHNARSGCCFPSYEAIAVSAGCNRDTVFEALKVLELARVLTWQNRIARIAKCASVICSDAGQAAGASYARPTPTCFTIRTRARPVFPLPSSKNPSGTRKPGDSWGCTGTSGQPEQPFGVRLAAARRWHQSKIAQQEGAAGRFPPSDRGFWGRWTASKGGERRATGRFPRRSRDSRNSATVIRCGSWFAALMPPPPRAATDRAPAPRCS